MKFMQQFVLSFALMGCGLFCASARAGQIVTGATVIHVSSTNGNTTAFQVLVAGGVGVCTSETGTWIVFPLSAAADADTHKRTYAAALLALATGMRVNLHNYASDSCTGASYVDVYN
jgi:hypothetical protein